MRIACALGILAIASGAQDRPETVIRTTTRLVQIRVMAEDSHGDPVTNLRKDELRFEDNRKPRPVDFFTFEGNAPAAGGAESAANSSDDTRNDYAVILLDWLNPPYAERVRGREFVDKLLKTFQPRQQVALYLMAKHSRLLHDFTSNPAELAETLANTELEPEDPLDPSKPGLVDPRLKTWATLTVEERMFGFNLKILDTIEALGKLTDGLARIAGRKTVIWLTNGFPIQLDRRAVPGAQQDDVVDYGEYAEPLIDKLNRANVALYTVDACGLSFGCYKAPDTLQELSARTGAAAFIGRNDRDGAMREAFEDSKTGYTLGFTPESDAAPGVHDIRLRTTRPGVVLRYRESYQLSAGL